MDSGDPTTARLSPVASTSTYFLQLDDRTGQVDILDGPMTENRTMDLSGDETVYEIRDEDYFLTGQFMDHGLSEMDDPVVDISDLLDKPLQGFLQDEPVPGSSFTNYSTLTSMSGYEEIRGSERDTVQQAIDEAYGAGSLSDPIVLSGDDNNMIICVDANPDVIAQASSQPNVTISEIRDSMSIIGETEAMPVILNSDNDASTLSSAIYESKEIPVEVPLVIGDITMQDISMGKVEEEMIEVQQIPIANLSESEQIVQCDPSDEKISLQTPICSEVQTPVVLDTAVTEESIIETSNVSLLPTSVVAEENCQPDSEEGVNMEETEMDFDIKIVSCYSQYQPEIDQESEHVVPNDDEYEFLECQLKPEVDLNQVQEVTTEREEESPEVIVKQESKVEREEESPIESEPEGPDIVGRTPHVPEWLAGVVDPNDELLLAYKNRSDPMMTVICAFCYIWFNEKEDLQEHIITEHAKKKSKFHKCKICDAKFVARILRIRHEKLHRYDLKRPWFMYAPKLHPYDALVKNHFTKRFRPAPLSDSYRSHLSEVFSLVEKLSFECHACEDVFADEESVREHYERSHALQSCRFCGKVSGNWAAAVQHEKEYHGQYEIEDNYIGGAWHLWNHWRCDESLEKEEIVSNIAFFHNYRKRMQDEPPPFEEEFIQRDIVFNPSEDSGFFKTEYDRSWGVGSFGDGSFQIKEEMDSFMYEQGSMEGDDVKIFQSLKYKCAFCPKSYDNEHDLRRHARCHSGEKPPLACQYCGKGFKTHSHKKEHERTHTNEKPYCCPICDRSFIQSSNLKKHIQTHKSLNTLQCDTCGKQFIKESSLILHQRAHAQDRKFRCHICDRAYNYASLLKRHMRIHTGETPYNCDVCGMLFHELVSLHYHRKKVHTGERPHSCETCGRAFILSSDLKKHLQIHLKPPSERVAKKTSRRSRSQSKSLECDGSTNELAVALETDQESNKLYSLAEDDEKNHSVDSVEEVQLDSDEELLASPAENLDDVPVLEKPPLRVYQRREVKIPVPEEIKEAIENSLEVLESSPASGIQEINAPKDLPSESLTNNDLNVTDACDKGLFSNDIDEIIEESLATVVLDENGQEIVSEELIFDAFS